MDSGQKQAIARSNRLLECAMLYSDSEAILSDVLVRYMTCKTRRISRQPYSAFDMGDFRVLATS